MNKLSTLVFLLLCLSFLAQTDSKAFQSDECINDSGTKVFSRSVLVLNSSNLIDYDSAEVEIYPNPFNEKFTLSLINFPVDILAVHIYDQIGNAIYSTSVDNRTSNNSYEVDVAKLQLRPGIFFLKLESKSMKTKVVRLIKQ